MSISEDASTPAPSNPATVTSGVANSATFSPPAGCWVYTEVTWLLGTNMSGVTLTAKDSSGTTHASIKQQEDGDSATISAIFSHEYVSAPGSIHITITASTTAGASALIAPRVVNGAASSQTGAATAATTIHGSTAITGSITTTQPQSWVYVVGSGPGNVTLTAASATTLTATDNDAPTGDTGGVGRQTSATGTPGATTLGFTSSASIDAAWVAVEVLPASSSITSSGSAALSPLSFSGTVTVANPVTMSGSFALPPLSFSGSEAGVSVIASWISGAADAGLLDVPISNISGNALIAVHAYSALTSGIIPVSYAADDTHNWWDRLYNGSSASHPACTIWMAASARPASHVSLATSWAAAAPAAAIYEISGLPAYGATATSARNQAGGLSTAPSVSVSANAGDTVFCSVATFGSPGTVTYPSGWTSLTPATATDAGGTTGAYSAFVTASSTGTITANWGLGSSAAWTAVIVVFPSNAPAAPAAPRAGWPAIIAEAAFGAAPGDPTQAPSWTDITSRVMNDQGQTLINASRGRDYELTADEAGDFSLNLLNNDGAVTPYNPASPYYPDVLPETPVRVSAVWNGIRYAVCAGNAEKWPQQFPMPQWGMSQLAGADALSVLGNIIMPSALGGEILLDSPYLYIPCGEIYNEADGLPLSNASRTNQRPAICMDASQGVAPLATGQSVGINGDMGTGIGYSGITGALDSSLVPGAYYEDPNLPQMPGGITAEFWAVVPSTRSATDSMELMRLQSNASNYWVNSYRGARVAYLLSSGGLANIVIQDYVGNSYLVIVNAANLADGKPHHYAFAIGPNGSGGYAIAAYLDGALANAQTITGVTILSDINLVGLGPVDYYNSGYAVGYNYAFAHLAIFGQVLLESRIAAHYNSGLNGSAGDNAAARVLKLMMWGGYAGPRAAISGDTVPLLGPGDQIENSSMANAANTVASTDGGMFFADAAGNATYWPRQYFYNRKPRWIFGDNPSGGETPYDPSAEFSLDNTYIYNVAQSQRTIDAGSFANTGKFDPLTGNWTTSGYGATAIAIDNSSVRTYYRRGPLETDIETVSDQDAYDIVNWNLAQYRQPQIRVDTIELIPSANPSLWPVALGIEQGDICQVIRRPMGGAEINVTVVVQKIEHNVTPDEWKTTLSMSPYTIAGNVLQCDVSGYDNPSQNVIGW